jgi:hypothetical protein
MSKRARIIIALTSVAVAGGLYLWFLGVQTFCAVEGWNIGRRTPVVKIVPVALTDLSVSNAPGTKLSYFGYQFEVPWDDVDETKTKVIGGDKAIIAFRSGNVLSLWLGSPHDLVNTVLSSSDINRNAFRQFYGDEALESDYVFHRLMLDAAPSEISPFGSKKDAVTEEMLILMKAISVPRGAESGIFEVTAGDFRGFQFGRPQDPDGHLSVDLYSAAASLDFIFGQKIGGPAVISQPDVNRILSTLHKESPETVALDTKR